MKPAHKNVPIRQANFDAVEDLVKAMDAHGVGKKLQGEVLALLAPMAKDIVNR